MSRLIRRLIVVATFLFVFVTGQNAWAGDAQSEPELVMKTFLRAFVAYDYETCRSLLAPGATIAITRRYRGGPYEHDYQTAGEWLNEVGDSGVKELVNFSVDIHETASLIHEHGATVVARFTATAGAGGGIFQNLGFDTGSLINTEDGWRIIHYSSFEDFRWNDGATID